MPDGTLRERRLEFHGPARPSIPDGNASRHGYRPPPRSETANPRDCRAPDAARGVGYSFLFSLMSQPFSSPPATDPDLSCGAYQILFLAALNEMFTIGVSPVPLPPKFTDSTMASSSVIFR